MRFGPQVNVSYKRARFSTRLPAQRLYTAAHFWIAAQGDDLWRVGFTKFATRMLGELVEHGFEVKPGESVEVGQIIGWMEGFKAATDLYCVVTGKFQGENPELEQRITRVHTDPYGRGWLYQVKGTPEPKAVDVQGYVDILNTTIDRLQGKTS